MNFENALSTLSHLSGPGGCRTNNVRLYALDGVIPHAVVTPRTVGQISEILAFASAEGFSVFPWGGGTSIAGGSIPERYDIALSLSKMDAILELEPEDLTCSVQAGITLDELNAVLSEYNLFTSIDPPCADDATLGGITAANVYGPLRHQYGTIKDQILGMSMVLSDGTQVKGGGKVVKNVAGYDVHKLFIGSEGTLGVITGLNLRLRPLPLQKKTMLLSFSSIPEAVEFADRVIHSYITPEFLIIACRGTLTALAQNAGISVPPETTGLLIGIDNHPKNVEWQSDEIRRMVEGRELRCLSMFENSMQDSLRRAIRDYPRTFDAELILKINFLLSDFIELYQRQKELQKTLHHPAYLMIHPGTGVMHVIYGGIEKLPEADKDAYGRFVDEEIQLISEFGGEFSSERAPAWIKNRIPVRGRKRRDHALMQAVKTGLDPKNIMSPGRLNSGW